jgi:hypothetical protein
MVTALNRKVRLTLTLVGAMMALSVGLIAGPAAAQASTSNYCGGVLNSGAYCFGAARWQYHTYGWGDQQGVCVGIVGYPSEACTYAANTGVYSAHVGSNVWAQPFIHNLPGVSNNVHGVALTH